MGFRRLVSARRRAMGAVVAVSLLVALPATASGGETITGTLRMLGTGSPVTAMPVQACVVETDECYFSEPSDADGGYEIVVPVAGDYSLTAQLEWDDERRPLARAVTAPTTADVWIYEPVEVSGTVVDDGSGEPVGDVQFTFICTVPDRGRAAFLAQGDAAGVWTTDADWAAPPGCETDELYAGRSDEFGQFTTFEVVSYTPFTPPATDVEVRLADPGPPPPPPSFTDVDSGHPFYRQITTMAAQDVIRGYPNGTFRPTVAVTRQAAAAFLYRLAGEPEVVAEAGFDDVPADHPFHDAIAWMVERDITSGYSNNTFRPTAPVTRQAAAAFLWRYDGAWDDSWEASFNDVGEDHDFHTAIGWMAEFDISTGWPDGTFRPNEQVTRQSMAAFLSRFMFGE